MYKLCKGLPLLALSALVLAAAHPLAAQREIQWNSVENGADDRDVSFRSNGTVSFTEDGWVKSISRGGSVTVEERRPRRRRAEFRPAPGGGVAVRYFVDGAERRLDREGRAWASRLLLRGAGPARRVPALRARGGVDAVLAETGRAESDTERMAWYGALLDGAPLRAGDFVQVARHAARNLGSDGQKRRLFAAMLGYDGVSREGVLAVVEGARGLASDTERRRVLAAVPREWLRDGRVAAAYRAAAGEMKSSTERSRALGRLGEDGR